MHRTGRLAYVDRGTFAAVELPYKGDLASMVVLLPRDVDGLAALEATLTPELLASTVEKLAPRQVDLALPKLHIEGRFQLAPTLSDLGMPAAFTGSADFSGIDDKNPHYISAVVHQTFVDVDEDGTEAAAATAVLMFRGSVQRTEPPVVFRADHPFLFLIRDRPTGTILFLGRLANPKA